MLALLAIASPALVQAQDPYGLGEASQINVGTSTKDLRAIIASVINIALGFLGILAVVIILYAGFKWMTAAGNEDQVSDARKMLMQAVIGLAVIFLAWAIANFVIDSLVSSTGAPEVPRE